MSTEQAKAVCAICGHKMTGALTSHPDHLITPIDTSALRALQEVARAANGAWGPHHRPDVDYRTALVNAAPALLDELDQLREARAMAWVSGLHAGIRYASLMGKPGFEEPTNPFLSIPTGPKAGE